MKNGIYYIIKKELLTIFRNKKILISLLLSILIFPIYKIGIDYISQNNTTKVKICIVAENGYIPQEITDFILMDETVSISKIDCINSNIQLSKGSIDSIIKINKSDISFIYNSLSFNSMLVTSKLCECFQSFYGDVQNNRKYNISIINENGKKYDNKSSISHFFIPLIFIIISFKPITIFSTDIFVGEKDRKTMELLLLSGIKRKNIYYGKSITIVIISFLNQIINLVMYYLSNICKNDIHILPVFVLSFFMSIIASFLLSSISMFSKDIKVCQMINESIMMTVIAITAMICLGVIKTKYAILNFIPILNIIIGINNGFAGKIQFTNFLCIIITNVIFLKIIAFLSIRYINSEKILQ